MLPLEGLAWEHLPLHPCRCRARASAGAGLLPFVRSYARAALAALPPAPVLRIATQSSVRRLPKFKTGSGIFVNAIPAFVRRVLFVIRNFSFRHFSAQKIEVLLALSTLQVHSDSTTMQVTYPSPY